MNSIETYLTAFGGLLTALGGWEFIRYLINRSTEKRKAEAEADNVELETMRKHYDWTIQSYENRIEALTEKLEKVNRKVDDMYVRMRHLEQENMKLLKRNNELELELKVAQYNVCERPDDDCIRRLPARQKCRLRMLLNGTYEAEDKEAEDKEVRGHDGDGSGAGCAGQAQGGSAAGSAAVPSGTDAGQDRDNQGKEERL